MQLQFSDIQGQDSNKVGLVLGLGPSLAKHLPAIKSIDQNKIKFKIISCNNIDKLTDINFDYWMLAQPADINSPFNIESNYNRYASRPKTTLLYTDCLDLTPRELVARLLGNINYLGYDQRHWEGKPCTWGNMPNGRHICCEHIIAGRKCIQEVLQEVTKTDHHYGTGDTVGVHMLALAVILGMNPIYVTGIDLDYTDGYVKNDQPDTEHRIAMGMSSINNSPAMVKRIIKDLTTIRDAAKNIGVDIYCLDKGLKISEIFPYAESFIPTDLTRGGIASSENNDANAKLINEPPVVLEITSKAGVADWPKFKEKPEDEYEWSGYTKEYSQQLADIKAHDGQDFFITDYMLNLVGLFEKELPKTALKFVDNLHDNWKQIYETAFRHVQHIQSIYEVGVGGGYHLKNLHKLFPKAWIAGCDLLQTQIDFAKEFSQLPPEIMENIELRDFTKDYVLPMQYDFVFTQAVIMHMSTEHAKAALLNMAKASKKYIFLVEGVANHDRWFDFVKATLPDWDFQLTTEHIDYGILLTKKEPTVLPLSPRSELSEIQQQQIMGRMNRKPPPDRDRDINFIFMHPYVNPPTSEKSIKAGDFVQYPVSLYESNTLEVFKDVRGLYVNEPGIPPSVYKRYLYHSVFNTWDSSLYHLPGFHKTENPNISPAPDNDMAGCGNPVSLSIGDAGLSAVMAMQASIDGESRVVTNSPAETSQAIIREQPIIINPIPSEPLFVFTEIIGCAEVGKVAIESFHKHHDHLLHIFATKEDIKELGEIATHKNNVFFDMSDEQELLERYKKGHGGTAYLFTMVFSGQIFTNRVKQPYNNIVHFDGDVFFKKESLSTIDKLFESGYDIIGSRRCYKNNPAKIEVKDGIPDTVSTYFFGMKRSFMPKYSFGELVLMYMGHPIGLDHEVFDFGDAVTFHALKNGAKIFFLSSEQFGGQDESGSKVNSFQANLHIDMGSHLAHFGGAGSGCVCYKHPEGKNESYGRWAVIRYALFCNIFFDQIIPLGEGETKFDEKGRWVSGNFDEEILGQIKFSLADDKIAADTKSSAPFTEQEVKNINDFQVNSPGPKLTCENDHGDQNRVLIATKDGLKCPTCGYVQNWCHTFITL